MVVVMGRQAWEMPIPLVRGDAGWRFDTATGIEEISDRRIGRNELTAIGLARAYVEAQIAYASADRDGDMVLEYAQKVVSAPGQRDGLYWPPGTDGKLSPLGPLVAQADAKDHHRRGEPYHGYYFKVLTGQGAKAPGGAYSYVINGNMVAGFALIAWPAAHGRSGVMTFLVNNLGRVLEKDLGPDTAAVVAAATAYDPDPGWAEVPAEDNPT